MKAIIHNNSKGAVGDTISAFFNIILNNYDSMIK